MHLRTISCVRLSLLRCTYQVTYVAHAVADDCDTTIMLYCIYRVHRYDGMRCADQPLVKILIHWTDYNRQFNILVHSYLCIPLVRYMWHEVHNVLYCTPPYQCNVDYLSLFIRSYCCTQYDRLLSFMNHDTVVCLSVCPSVRPSVTLCIAAPGVGIGVWELYRRVPRRPLSIHFLRPYCAGM